VFTINAARITFYMHSGKIGFKTTARGGTMALIQAHNAFCTWNNPG
jgi:hypothetical protein